MIGHKSVSLISIFLIYFISFPSSSTYAQSQQYHNDPQAILNEVNAKGASSVVSELYKDLNAWYSVLRNIATGEKEWLRVAIALQPGAQAGSYNMLQVRLGEALEHNPENVLIMTAYKYVTPFICGGPDIDDKRYGTYELAMEAIKRRQEKVRAITNPKLKEICDDCLKSLEQSKTNMARFYQVNQ